MGLSTEAVEWLRRERKISQKTAERFGVSSGMRYIEGSERNSLTFPYYRGDKLINEKYRSFPKKGFNQLKGGELRFWNLDAVLDGISEKTIWIVEGELDFLAAIEAGLPEDAVLSVPNGTTENVRHDGLGYAERAVKEGIIKSPKIVIAVDRDKAGYALRHTLVNMFTPGRCWFLEWPDGINDANDFLIRCGPGELRDFMESEAQSWPVSGLYRMSELPEPTPIEVWRPGFPEWENKVGFAPGMVSIFTGYPGHGKTILAMQLWHNICREYDLRAAIASFETEAKPHQRRNLRQFYHRQPLATLADSDVAKADEWIDDHFLWVSHPERRPSFKWFLDLAEVAVIRHGVKIVQIDPWNKLEADRPSGERETDWIRDRLNEAMNFAKDMRVHFQILAHPAKSIDISQRRQRPVLEDISGSRHWENIADQGFAVFRPKIFEDGSRQTGASLYHLKARFEDIGYPCRLDLNFDLATMSYRSVDYHD